MLDDAIVIIKNESFSKMDRGLDRKIVLSTASSKLEGTNYQAAWDISDSFLNTMRNGYQIVLTQCTFSNLRYPTNDNNNRIYFQEAGGGTLVGVIQPGNYLPAEYAAAVKVAMDAAGAATYTITFSDPIRDLFTIASTSTVSFSAGTYSFNHQIGLSKAQLNQAPVASLVTTMPYKLNGPAAVIIRCMSGPILSSYHCDGVSQILAVIPTGAGYGEDIAYSAQDIDPLHVSGDNFRHIRLDMYDDQMNIYVLPENVVVTYELKIIPGDWSEEGSGERPRKRFYR